ncbi:MAG: amino acid ABC transporter permease [Tissierellia bacterium]|nr:amino acid ABC transporter permease [Tissierellia bacterium]
MLHLLSKYRYYYITGIKTTLLLSLFSLILGSALGVILSLMRLSKNKFFNFISTVYVEIFRGTPLFVQLSMVYIGISMVLGLNISAFVGGLIAVSLNSAAYISEIIRAGIQSVDKGQREAGLSLGLDDSQIMKKIILPQAVKNILPALGNEFITLIKETSIVATIGVFDLYYAAQKVNSITYWYSAFVITAMMYFVITFTLSKVMNHFERKIRHDNH